MINENYIIVLDFETGSKDKFDPTPLEIACVVVDPRTLKRVPGETFECLIKPFCRPGQQDGWENVQEEALKVNKINPEEVKEKGLDEKVFFDLLCKFFKRHTKGNKWKSPVVAGFNSDSFDRIILERLCHRYNYLDKGGDQKLFHPRDSFDVMKMVLGWTENEVEPIQLNLAEVKRWFGITEGIEHRAMGDVEPTADILCRLLEFQRKVVKKNKPQFKGAFSRGPN